MASDKSNDENDSTNCADTTSADDAQSPKHLSSPTVGGTKSNLPPSHGYYQITCKTEKDWRDRAKFWAELIVGAFVILYTFVTIGIWCSARRTIELDQTAQITITNIRWRVNRSVEPPKRYPAICSDDGNSQRVCFEIDFVNGSKGPATESKIRAHTLRPTSVENAKYLIENKFTFPALGKPRGLQPISSGPHEWNAHTEEEICETDACIRQDEVDRLLEGKEQFFIYGVFQYRDIYKKEHATRFCFTHPPSACIAPGGCWTPCDFGNTFDQPGDVP